MASKEYEHRQMLMNLRAFADKNLRFTRLDDEKFSAHITWVVPLGGSFVLPLIPGVPGLNEEKDVENPMVSFGNDLHMVGFPHRTVSLHEAK